MADQGLARVQLHLRPWVFTGWRGLLVTLVAGGAAGLGQVPFSLPAIGLLGFAAGFALLLGARSGFVAGWAFGTGYFLLTLHWIVEPFLVDIERHGWMAPFALVFLAAGLALFWGAAFGLARAYSKVPLPCFVAWVGALALAELARGYVLTGFPWALPGYMWLDTPLADMARAIGPYGLTLSTFALAGAIGLLAVRQVVPLVLVLPLAAWAWFAPQPPAPEISPDRPVVRLIQPNAAQHEKWQADKVNMFFNRQLQFTAAPSKTPPDLMIWSETAIAWDITENALAREMIADAARGTPVALGIQRITPKDAFNSLALTDADGQVAQLYDKHHLVPFGEYMPLQPLMSRIGIQGLAAFDDRGFSSGPGPLLIDTGPLGMALPLICYEAIFPQNIRGAPARPDWLLQITNDAWFGQIAGPQQHLAQARFRALEYGLPMVRVANTGISAVIDARGQITARLPLNEAGFLDAALPPAIPPTLYAWTGDMPALAAALALLFTGIALGTRKTD